MLLELTGLRRGSTSTIFCARPKKSDWRVRLGSDVRAAAIVDRIVSNAVWLNIGEENMRKRMAERGGVAARPVLTRDIAGLGLQ